MYSSSLKRRAGRRISVWVLVFAMALVLVAPTFIIPVSASKLTNGAANAAEDMGNAIGNAAEDIGDGMGEAMSDVGDGVGEAITDVTDSTDDGKVNDTDGMIGNEESGADKNPTTDKGEDTDGKSNGGWIALAIAIVVIVAVVVLIVVMIPRRKDKE